MPCKVIREITDADQKKLFRDEEIDEEPMGTIGDGVFGSGEHIND